MGNTVQVCAAVTQIAQIAKAIFSSILLRMQGSTLWSFFADLLISPTFVDISGCRVSARDSRMREVDLRVRVPWAYIQQLQYSRTLSRSPVSGNPLNMDQSPNN